MTSPQIVQALTIAAALKIYAEKRIRVNRAYTPNRMMQTAFNITGVKHKARDYVGAAETLEAWARVKNKEAPPEETPTRREVSR